MKHWKCLKKPTEHIRAEDDDCIFSSAYVKALETAMDALEEVQQYRAIGTVSEFAELKEKATAKRPFGEYFGWTCPNCGEYHHEKKSHCTECNQTILWT